ncbi:hypothetical protein ACROYT_G014428 [Oculina patagonica]
MLEVNDPTRDCSEGETNQIFVNRDKVLDTGMDEIKLLTNKRLTLEVQFYGEEAQDLGGPRKEFFKLIMQAVKEKYFDKGLLPHYENDYQTVGSIFGMF